MKIHFPISSTVSRMFEDDMSGTLLTPTHVLRSAFLIQPSKPTSFRLRGVVSKYIIFCIHCWEDGLAYHIIFCIMYILCIIYIYINTHNYLSPSIFIYIYTCIMNITFGWMRWVATGRHTVQTLLQTFATSPRLGWPWQQKVPPWWGLVILRVWPYSVGF